MFTPLVSAPIGLSIRRDHALINIKHIHDYATEQGNLSKCIESLKWIWQWCIRPSSMKYTFIVTHFMCVCVGGGGGGSGVVN